MSDNTVRRRGYASAADLQSTTGSEAVHRSRAGASCSILRWLDVPHRVAAEPVTLALWRAAAGLRRCPRSTKRVGDHVGPRDDGALESVWGFRWPIR